jgi:hypothetical protein
MTISLPHYSRSVCTQDRLPKIDPGCIRRPRPKSSNSHVGLGHFAVRWLLSCAYKREYMSPGKVGRHKERNRAALNTMFGTKPDEGHQ